MTSQYDDVYSIIAGKAGVKYAGIEIEAMRAVTDAYKARNIHRFDSIFQHYKAQLLDDPIISSHLAELKANLLEQNLLRILEPFSRVQVSHVAKLIRMGVDEVEGKLSEMILDKKLKGILDQGTGDLIVFDEQVHDGQYAVGGEIIAELSAVVDRLYVRAHSLRKVEVE
jgi:26S proteasome regulatory subunit N6